MYPFFSSFGKIIFYPVETSDISQLKGKRMNQMVYPIVLFIILSDYFKWVVEAYNMQIKMADDRDTKGQEGLTPIFMLPQFYEEAENIRI